MRRHVRWQGRRGAIPPYSAFGSNSGFEQVRLPARWEPVGRRVLDLVVVLLLSVLAIPILMLFIAVAIRLETPGPALYRQQVVGRGGRPFTMYKFRTIGMSRSNSQHRRLVARKLRGVDTSVAQSRKIDSVPRVTRLGSILRRTSIDRLPQLINVLRGQMSLVGPRPYLIWEVDTVPPKVAGRFDVQPGMTGLWWVSGRHMDPLMMQEIDLVYARSWSFWTDLAILLRTIPVVLRGDHPR